MKIFNTYCLVFVLMILSFLNCNCQLQKIKLTCPAIEPRVDEIFTLKLDLSFLNESYVKIIPDKIRFNFMEQHIVNSLIAKDTGDFVIGPYEFEFNGIKYSTNKLKIKVIESINKSQDGIYFRIVKNDSLSYLIYEQYKMKAVNSEDDLLCDFKVDDFVQLKNKNDDDDRDIFFKVNDLQFKIIDYSRGISSNYYSVRYVLEIKNDLRQNVVINRDYFLNLPDSFKLPILTVQKNN